MLRLINHKLRKRPMEITVSTSVLGEGSRVRSLIKVSTLMKKDDGAVSGKQRIAPLVIGPNTIHRQPSTNPTNNHFSMDRSTIATSNTFRPCVELIENNTTFPCFSLEPRRSIYALLLLNISTYLAQMIASQKGILSVTIIVRSSAPSLR